MDRLWAPWRMEYLKKADEGEGCVFCKAVSANEDRSHLILYRGSEVFVMLNRYPYSSGHMMIVPNVHMADILSFSSKCSAEIMVVCGRAMEVLKDILGSHGFNCGMNVGHVAGGSITDHFHFHVVPRWAGDVNFLPILGGVKAMPQYLEETYDKLAPGFKKLGGMK